MDLALTPDQEFLAETTRRFLHDKAHSTALRELRDNPVGYDPAYWRQGCELGWTSLLVSEADGGGTVTGEGVRDLAVLAYAFGKVAAPGPIVTTNVVAETLSRVGTAEQKAVVLPGLLSGEQVASWAIGEAAPNDGLGRVTLTAAAAGGAWRLDGTKVAVESGGVASHFLVSAQGPEGLTQFLIPAGTAGVTVRAMRTVDLTRRFVAVTFDGATARASAVVGAPGEAGADVRRQLQVANAVQCAEMAGALDTAMEMTVEWAFNRYSFGRPLASYQALKHRFADMKTWLEASKGLAEAAVRAVQTEAPNADEVVSAAKAYIGHFGPELCQECIQLHGGIGVTFEHDMHLYLRRVTLQSRLFGTVRDHRLRLADILEARLEQAKGAA